MKSIAFYLPQFHPIPQNDEWWGRGFTEWTNVARAKPRFRGHHQPQVPADLGFYDLRLDAVRRAQIDLARQYGLGGFCYYHYWFDGQLLLETPLEAMLADSESDFPFCLCWPTEPWTRRWDGGHNKVLMGQDFENYDLEGHFEYLGKFFADSRYIRIDDKPVFLIYNTDGFPDLRATIAQWRAKAVAMGLPGVYIGVVHSHAHRMSDRDAIELGFDAVVGFEPHWETVKSQFNRARLRHPLSRLWSLVRRNSFVAYDYEALARVAMQRPEPTERRFPCVFPSWDNTSRRASGATVIQNDDAALFEQWLRDATERVSSFPEDEQLVFINAWNEWAEGCHLEPDLRNGHRFLEAVQRVMLTKRSAM